MNEGDPSTEITGLGFGMPIWGLFSSFCELPDAQRNVIASTMTDCNMTCATADDFMNQLATVLKNPWIRPKGDGTLGMYLISEEHLAINIKAAYFLNAAAPDVVGSELTLPTFEEAMSYSMTDSHISKIHWGTGAFHDLFLSVAMVHEKLERPAEAITFADGCFGPKERGGTELQYSHVVAHLIRGRSLAVLGRVAEAGIALEAAADTSQRLGLRLFEAFALRDLKLSVMDAAGHGEQASRRLGAALRQWPATSPLDALTPFLKGLDAVELAALPPPDPVDVRAGLPEGAPPPRR